MTAPGEVDDPRILIPMQRTPYEAMQEASVPMATDAEVGDTVALVPTGDPQIPWAAAPMRVPEVGETVVLQPIANPRGGIKWLGIPTAKALPAPWFYVTVSSGAPVEADVISATSAVILIGNRTWFQTDDNGATWTNRGLLIVEDGSPYAGAQIIPWDCCGLHEMDGRWLLHGRASRTGARPSVWMFNPETGKFTLVFDTANAYQGGSLCQVSSGYVFACPGYNSGATKYSYFSADGLSWALRGTIPAITALPIYPNTHIVCFGGDVIGYVADKNLWRSTDAGATWERCLTDDLNYWYEKRPIAWENGHVACYRQKSGAWQVAHSANSGATWTTSAIPADPNIYRMPESNPLNAGVAISIVLAYYLLEIHSELSTDYAATWGELAVELPTTAGRKWGCYGATWPSGLMFAPRHDDQLGQMIIWVGEP